MTERPTPTPYWDAQEPVGEVPLSERDTLVATNVRRGPTWYLRLQVHRKELVNGVPTSTPGQRGVILPITTLVAVMDLLQQSVGQLPYAPDGAAEEDDWSADTAEP